MKTVTSILRSAFALPYLEKSAQYLMDKSPCAICQKVIAEAYPIGDMISQATANIADTFRASEWLCADCAACFADSRTLTGSIFATETIAEKPLVTNAEGRAQWRELIQRDDLIGQECVAIITSNTKRRLWTSCVVSRFGDSWQSLFVDGDTDLLLTISVTDLRQCLALVEEIYALGISKQAMTESLIHSNNMRFMQMLGLSALMAYERQLEAWRTRQEFIVSLFIAQKPIEEI